MSLSITHRTADLQILTPPPAPQPPVIQLNTDPSLLVQLATAYRDWLPQPPPDPAPILAPLFREGPFDAASCPKTTTRHPLIGTQQDGCPYRFTSYRNYEHFHVVARLAYNFTPPPPPQNLPDCSAGHPENGSGSFLGSKHYTLRSSSNVTLTS